MKKSGEDRARVVGIDGKTIIVKHGDSLREIARVHVTRIQSAGLKEDIGRDSFDTPKLNEKQHIEGESDEIIVTRNHLPREDDIEDDEEQVEEHSEVEELNEETNEIIPNLKKGDRIRAENKETEELRSGKFLVWQVNVPVNCIRTITMCKIYILEA